MKEIDVSLREKLPRGTLLWVYADDNKVYRSSKRFDKASFSEHDSNYVGEIDDVYSGDSKSLIFKMLEKSDRIYGICLIGNSELGSIEKNTLGDVVKFFSTWNGMLSYANNHFEELDKKMERREEMKRQWLKRGQEYIQKQK